jgi:hypothetical protein
VPGGFRYRTVRWPSDCAARTRRQISTAADEGPGHRTVRAECVPGTATRQHRHNIILTAQAYITSLHRHPQPRCTSNTVPITSAQTLPGIPVVQVISPPPDARGRRHLQGQYRTTHRSRGSTCRRDRRPVHTVRRSGPAIADAARERDAGRTRWLVVWVGVPWKKQRPFARLQDESGAAPSCSCHYSTASRYLVRAPAVLVTPRFCIRLGAGEHVL